MICFVYLHMEDKATELWKLEHQSGLNASGFSFHMEDLPEVKKKIPCVIHFFFRTCTVARISLREAENIQTDTRRSYERTLVAQVTNHEATHS